MNDPRDLDAMIDAASALLGIAVAPEWREAIRLHLAISLGHAHAVADFALPDEADPAPVFRA
jgi:1-carboxybiuret hydrolase subunit AtzG-like